MNGPKTGLHYAMCKQVREVPIGKSAAEFLRSMGIDKQGQRYLALRTDYDKVRAKSTHSRG